ncbi:MAG: lysylphosphatidylglycerol synthase transmembrane domain-containing protein [Thermodesulfobacteriota bacterium]
MKSRFVRLLATGIFRILVPAAFFAYVFHVIQIHDVLVALDGMDWSWFLAGCLCVLFPLHLSSLRTKELVASRDLRIVRLWMIHAMSSLIGGVLPFRTGELAYVYYLRRYCGIAVSEGTAVWVSFRFMEYLIALALLFCLSAAALVSEPSPLFWTIVVLIGANLLVSLFVVWKIDLVYQLLGGTARFLARRRAFSRLGGVVAGSIDTFVRQVGDAFSRNASARLLLLSSGIVILRYSFILAMVCSMGAPMSLGLATFLFVFLYAAKLVQGVGSFGSQEAGIAAALMLCGMSQVEALPVAIGTHLLQWAPILGLGILGYIGLRLPWVRS